MIENELTTAVTNEYFEWMYQLVCGKKTAKYLPYRKLLVQLHDRPFIARLRLDENRMADGVDLRYRFGCERGYNNNTDIQSVFSNNPCSILEMMVALSLRMEEHIMSDPAIGDRTGKWFWGMIDNLGLHKMTSRNYDPKYIDDVLTRFLDRQYQPNGLGGLFTIHDRGVDCRTTEIWYQMCWYLDEILQRSR